MANWQDDLERSRKATSEIVWPAIKSAIGGGTLRVTEGSKDGTDLALDQEGATDAWQRTDKGVLRSIAFRNQFGPSAYWTTTTRLRRDSGTRTERAKMEAAITDGGHLPSFTIHSYLSLDGKRLLASSIVETRALQMHYSECVKGTTGARCYTKRTSNAVFIASDWRHLMAAAVPVIVVAPGQPCMYPLVEEAGLVWGCKPETLDLARVVNSLVKCGACGSWSTAPVAAAGVLRGTGT